MPEPKKSLAPAHPTISVLQAVLPDILHEMSQPLGVLRCGLEVAQMRGHANGQPADLKLWLQQTEQLSELLDVVRQLAEIEGSKAESAVCELAGLMRAILNDLRPIAEPRGVALRMESPHPLQAQASDQRMYAALQAVLAHAVERAVAGQSLLVTLRPVQAEAWISISGLRPQPGEWQMFTARGADSRAGLRQKKVWPLILAQCTVYRAGGMFQCDAAAGGDGNLLIRLPLAR